MNEIQFLLNNTPDENIKVNVIVKDETLWLTQKAMAELFDVNSQAITKHLKNIFDKGELSKDATCSKMEQVQKEFDVDFYTFAYEAFCLLNIKYSQENEFFID